MKNFAYDRESAVAYARKWALARNPKYYDFERIGGDCTNFASQCIHAGSRIMNYRPVMGWYYISSGKRTPSWSGVQYLYDFLISNRGIGPYAEVVPLVKIQPGDIIQLRFQDVFQHSPVVISAGAIPNPDNILIAAHTYDSLDRPLSSYTYAEARGIHVLGVRK